MERFVHASRFRRIPSDLLFTLSHDDTGRSARIHGSTPCMEEGKRIVRAGAGSVSPYARGGTMDAHWARAAGFPPSPQVHSGMGATDDTQGVYAPWAPRADESNGTNVG